MGENAQGPRGMALGARNLTTLGDEHLALGEGPLFRGFVVFFCRGRRKQPACQSAQTPAVSRTGSLYVPMQSEVMAIGIIRMPCQRTAGVLETCADGLDFTSEIVRMASEAARFPKVMRRVFHGFLRSTDARPLQIGRASCRE